MRIKIFFFSFFLYMFLPKNGYVQTISNDRLKELFRAAQLSDNFQTGHSLSVNPNQIEMAVLDSAMKNFSPTKLRLSKHAAISFLPTSLALQYNSKLPYDWNNGSMIPARGFQSKISFGAFASIGKHFTIQIAPEFISAENKEFETFSQELGNAVWTSYYQFLNTSDIPEQFGLSHYTKILPGQSSIRYNTNTISFGISTENLWWGPGYKNSLVMSTNAPGFLHATINTIKPIKTRIGEFEGQIVGGTLQNSGILPPRINSVDPQGNFLYIPKIEDTRYLTGMILTWRPKWTPNLFLGISKASYLYTSNINNPIDAFPLQGFFGRAITENEKNGKKASMGSLFFRYVMPKESAEIYMELGRKDISLMPWNIIQNEQYRRAYVVGIRKLFDSKNGSHIQLTAELTQMQAPTAELIREPDSWYTHQYVRQGYTHMGRSIGAGIGPGSNSQTVEISWVKGLKKIGIEFERLRHNSDFYYYAFESIGDYRRHWINISSTIKADWNYKNLFFSGQFGIIRAYNHEWLIVQYDPTNYFIPGNEILNFSGRLAVSYRF